MDIRKIAREAAKKAALSTYREIMKMAQNAGGDTAAVAEVQRVIGTNGTATMQAAPQGLPLASDWIKITASTSAGYQKIIRQKSALATIGQKYSYGITAEFENQSQVIYSASL